MSSVIYFLADLYPWWGMPLALIFAERAVYFRRQGNRKKVVRNAAIGIVFLSLTIAYFALNGLEKMRPALMELERVMFNKK